MSVEKLSVIIVVLLFRSIFAKVIRIVVLMTRVCKSIRTYASVSGKIKEVFRCVVTSLMFNRTEDSEDSIE